MRLQKRMRAGTIIFIINFGQYKTLVLDFYNSVTEKIRHMIRSYIITDAAT